MKNKPPAFQFYASDFLEGTADLSQEELGAYIRLLCHQWNRGSIPCDPERLRRMAGGDVSAAVLEKFPAGEDGCLRNPRLELARKQADDFRDERAKSGKVGASKRWNGSAIAQPSLSHSSAIAQPMAKHSSSSSSSSSKHERERARETVERPSLPEVLAAASMTGLAEWKATDWWNEMEGCGWIDYQHRPVANWRSVLQRVKCKWESDGRPDSPPKPRTNGNSKPVQPNPRNLHVCPEAPGQLKPSEVIARREARREAERLEAEMDRARREQSEGASHGTGG